MLEWFLIAQLVLPMILYFPHTQALRVPIRMGPFVLSLWMMLRRFLSVSKRPMSHPVYPWLSMALLYIMLMVAHPGNNNFASAMAQAVMYLSVAVPVFWAPALVRSPWQIRRLLTILLFFNGINALVGVLQVYYPGAWMPRELSDVVLNYETGLGGLTYIGANGEKIIRPPGLSDNPGAVSAPGMYAALLGTIFSASPLGAGQRVLSLCFAVSGFAVVYLTHVRTALLILLGMLAVYCIRLLISRWHVRGVFFLGIVLLVDTFSFKIAYRVGGQAVLERFSSLTEEAPMAVYERSGRLSHLKDTLKYLDQYPLGAGLGRWGMMYYYFGDKTNYSAPQIWSEQQFPCWALDGGYVLIILYSLAILIAVLHDYRVSQANAEAGLRFWTYALFAFNIGTIALVFGSIPFLSQTGLLFWFLVGVMRGAREASRENESLRPG